MVVFAGLLVRRIRVEERALERAGEIVESAERVSADPNSSKRVGAMAALTTLTLRRFISRYADLFAVPDRGDPLFSIWRMAWVRHQLAIDPRHLFDANIFYPLPATLTYSDSMILPALATRRRWSWMHGASCRRLQHHAAGGIHSFRRRRVRAGSRALGVDHWVMDCRCGLHPRSLSCDHFSHFELQLTIWMPIVLLCVHRLVDQRPSAPMCLALGLALAAQWYSSMYYGLFLDVYVATFGVVLIVSGRIRRPSCLVRRGSHCSCTRPGYAAAGMYARTTG